MAKKETKKCKHSWHILDFSYGLSVCSSTGQTVESDPSVRLVCTKCYANTERNSEYVEYE